ncbi:Zn-ribbon domain-containing OB-fold protein [Natranaeroarchaeum aerophilus]|uniref:OB-fold domain-containing protein n=1 Tax=Natranaeroarchaeum aerophilus TaxID=2917711 RepID=A0AAE3FQU8_9EURY|nr:OB-fold domain-containing protein [Natranaeroarchaeum aerophilus]MCL9813198.1 OB-fold domain-containing protein [Natranaeroarchaeum aerophilus]
MSDGTESVRDRGYDDVIDAIAEGEGYYLECPEGHGSLPPRRLCPECGDDTLRKTPLPDVGSIDTYTRTEVPAPAFADDAPYVLAIADFGSVRLTGQVQGVDPESISVGYRVTVEVAESKTTGERLLAFRKR